MKAAIRVIAGITAGGVLALFVLPFLVVAVVAGQLQRVSKVAATWDIPLEVVPVLQEAGQRAGIPWFLLAGVASVATDFARHGPDGVPRGVAPGTALFPTVTPPITAGSGAGMFLAVVDRGPAGTALADPQQVAAAALWLAENLSTTAHGDPQGGQDLSRPAVARFWQTVVAAAPLGITAIAPGGGGADLTPVDPGANLIRQFGAAVLSRIAAPATAANLGAFSAWAAGEGTCARFNPLATTQPEPGAVAFNNLPGGGHVWNYPSFGVGVQATTTALTNGLYQPVIDAFRASAGVAAVEAAVERSPWGTRHFGSPSYAGRSCGASGGSPAPDGQAPPPTLPTVTGPEAVAATIVARAADYQLAWSQLAALAAAG